MWYLIVSIPDLCTLTYFDMKSEYWQVDVAEQTGILQLSLYQAVYNGNGGSLLSVCVMRQVCIAD